MSKPSSKVEKIELPMKDIKLEPRGTTTPPQSLEDKFNVLFEVVKEIRSELKSEREIKERDRKEFQKIHKDSKENLNMVRNLYESMSIERANVNTGTGGST